MVSKYSVDIDPDDQSSHGLIVRLVGENKAVLDIGCATGDLARVLVSRGCRVSGVEVDPEAADAAKTALQRVVVGDVSQLDLAREFPDTKFDVVVLGDVLEHLVDPAAGLRQAVSVLAQDGYLVLSVPNVAHASVRLALARGEFRYTPLGLLDETHLRFFTRRSLYELLASQCLVADEVLRTVAPPFGTELQLEEEDFPPDLVSAVTADDDSTTYQFVLTARTAPPEAVKLWWRREQARADEVATRVQDHFSARGDELARLRSELAELQRELRIAQVDRQNEVAEMRGKLSSAETSAQEALEKVQAMRRSTSWRLSAPIRALGPLRAAVQGPVDSRRSLRRRGALRKVARHLRREGVRATAAAVRDALSSPLAHDDYAAWVEMNGSLSQADADAIRRHIADLPRRPLLSVIVPVYNTPDSALRAALDSVLDQLYERWELCVVDDASLTPSVWRTLTEYAARDRRVRLQRREANGGIAAATNDALQMAEGEFVVLLDHDDVLAPHALYMVAVEIIAHPDVDLIYSDEDKLDEGGRRYEPHFKPDFNHELLLGQNMISHLGAYRTSLVLEHGGMRRDLDGSQDHDLALRIVGATTRERIRHIPFVLYHWRQYCGSGTFSAKNLDKAAAAGRAAVRDHLARLGETARVLPAPRAANWNRVVWPVAVEEEPEVTVVIPTRDRVDLLRVCVDGLLSKTDYRALRLIVVDNDSVELSTLDYMERLERDARVTVLRAPGPFNYSALNNMAVKFTRSPLVLLLNNDIVVREPGWLREMVGLVQRDGVGVVGAKLLYADGRVQHAGVLLGIGGVAGHAHLHYPSDRLGYFGRLALVQEMSAVTGACMLTRREVFEEVGGLDEVNLAVAFNDVDYCLRVREAGYRVLWTPHAELTHLESVSRGSDTTGERAERFQREVSYMKERWGDLLDQDPAYSPNLSLTKKDFALEQHPRVNRPWVRYLS